MLGKQQALQAYTPYALAAIVTAYLFIQHGTAKLFGLPYQSMFDGLATGARAAEVDLDDGSAVLRLGGRLMAPASDERPRFPAARPARRAPHRGGAPSSARSRCSAARTRRM